LNISSTTSVCCSAGFYVEIDTSDLSRSGMLVCALLIGSGWVRDEGHSPLLIESIDSWRCDDLRSTNGTPSNSIDPNPIRAIDQDARVALTAQETDNTGRYTRIQHLPCTSG